MVSNPGTQTDTGGDTIFLKIIATDADNDILTYRVTGLPPGLYLNLESKTVLGMIAVGASEYSPYNVKVAVNDGTEASTVDFDWVILNPLVPGAKYVSPSGKNSNPGSRAFPWKTLKYALSHIKGGDTLYLREGTYWETWLGTNLTGSALDPTVITNFPGEKPVIDGGLKAFRQLGNTDWELVDAKIHLYRSVAAFKMKSVSGKFEDQGEIYSLSQYQNMNDLTTTNEFVGRGPRYVGPGVHYNSTNRRIYIRLQPSREQSLNGVSFAVPVNLDPRQTRLFLNNETIALKLKKGTSYLTFSGIDIANHYHGFRAIGADHITFSDLSITMSYGAILLDAGSHHILVDNVTVNAFFPPWVAWTDMKGSDGQYRPVSRVKPSGVSGTGNPLIHDIEIRNSLFNKVFDGHVFDGYNINIHHNTYSVLDDTVQIGTNSYEVEIHHNKIFGPGVSHNGRGDSSIAPGTKYIHHNIIDATKPMLWGRHDPNGILRMSNTGWHGQHPFPTHTGKGLGKGDPWKIYHNTILYDGTKHSGGAGHELWQGINSTGQAHEVYNNIFIQTSDNPIVDDQATTRDALQIYDGNLYFRTSGNGPLFDQIKDGSGTHNYNSLSDFLASQTFVNSKKLYSPGWEASGIEADPELTDPDNGNYLPAFSGPAASGAVDISNLGFPGLKGDEFRGCTDPEGAEIIGR